MRRKKDFRRRIISAALAAIIVFAAGAAAASIIMHTLYPMDYSDIVSRSCEEFGVDESLVYAIIHTESGFDAHARSEVGARGLMQIMPETFEWLQKSLPAQQPMDEEALYRPEVNIRYGVYYLSRLKALFGSDMLAVAAYHAGQGSVSRWLSESGLAAAAFGEDNIPSAATAHYVSKVERAREIYLRLYY